MCVCGGSLIEPGWVDGWMDRYYSADFEDA